jgi:hypothetical protein
MTDRCLLLWHPAGVRQLWGGGVRWFTRSFAALQPPDNRGDASGILRRAPSLPSASLRHSTLHFFSPRRWFGPPRLRVKNRLRVRVGSPIARLRPVMQPELRICRKCQNERRWRLRLREGVTVGLRSSSFWQGEHVCESGALLGFELRAKDVSPVQLSIPLPGPLKRYGNAPLTTQLRRSDPVRLILKGNVQRTHRGLFDSSEGAGAPSAGDRRKFSLSKLLVEACSPLRVCALGLGADYGGHALAAVP